jgi:aromatic ring-opening dioxygenase LigB subunit
MPLKSLYLLPHGGIIVPGPYGKLDAKSQILNEAMKRVAEEIEEDKIQIIILTSPHGYNHPSDYLIYYHNIFESWEIYTNQETKESSVERLLWQGNTDLAQILFQSLNINGIRAAPLVLGDPNFPMKIAWGETIPLSFLKSDNLQVLIFSTPMSQIADDEDSEKGIVELKKVGTTIEKLVNSSMFADVVVSVIISGDLSHRHDENHQYGYHESSAEFDKITMEWVKTQSDDSLMELYKLEPTANSCGLKGMTILQGIMENSESNWINKEHVYECPTYFGMTISSWKSE